MDAAEGRVRRALLSVSDKTGLAEFARRLHEREVQLVASGGTAKVVAEAGVPVTPVEQFTGADEVLGGRVKTLHPKVHAGILADRRQVAHTDELAAQGYEPVDLVVCNLYPFEETLAAGGEPGELIEKIDIGGPTMIRAAAKNCQGGTTVVVDPEEYDFIIEALTTDGFISPAARRRLAAKAFARTAAYDRAIAAWTDAVAAEDEYFPETDEGVFPKVLGGLRRDHELRYGENPHQPGWLYLDPSEPRGLAHGEVLQGKALSYNNFLDLDAAYRSVAHAEHHACAVIKHLNPCGFAEHEDQTEAFRRGLAGDPISAFGSILAFNQPLEGETVKVIKETKLFVECIVAPGFTPEALELYKKRKNLRLFQAPAGCAPSAWHGHRIGGGMLVQSQDPGLGDIGEWERVTATPLQDGWLEELAFAMRAVSNLKSNAIAITKDRALVGAGAGLTSRVDACELALKKAEERAQGAFLASDAFFPFDDCVRLAHAAGVAAVVQPGGSKRDDEVIAACDELGVAMVFTGRRHFRH